MQAGLAASQGASASYRQLQNETQLYAINMQFSRGQVRAFLAPILAAAIVDTSLSTLLYAMQRAQPMYSWHCMKIHCI